MSLSQTDNVNEVSHFEFNLSKVFVCDALYMARQLPDNSVHCVITSPPYGDLKDYGSTDQIGYGQDIDGEYFAYMAEILGELLRISVDGGALWVVSDFFRTRSRSVPLPYELARIATTMGWSFEDAITWEKDKNLPWTHKGRFRNVSESIQLFSKGGLNNFDVTIARSPESISDYWVKYPERFNPNGKAITDIWHFPIPTQGSWSNVVPRHFCPFPVEMVDMMIKIVTKENDVIFDPFAGIGTVPAVAEAAKRTGIGSEINVSFAKHFPDMAKALSSRFGAGVTLNDRNTSFYETIVKLRCLKFASTLWKKIVGEANANQDCGKLKDLAVFVVDNYEELASEGTFAAIEVKIYMSDRAAVAEMREIVRNVIARPPLSKFGIMASVNIIPLACLKTPFENQSSTWYLYEGGRFYYYKKSGSFDDLRHSMRNDRRGGQCPPILSTIGLRLLPQDS